MAFNTPIYAATPRNSSVAISTANTNRDGTGTIGTVFTAGANGSRIEQIGIVPDAAVTAGMVRLYIYTGAAYFLFKEIPVQALTPSGTSPVQPFWMASGNNIEMPLILPNGYSLRASTNNAETFHITAVGGDF